jgi:hypothetical protein
LLHPEFSKVRPGFGNTYRRGASSSRSRVPKLAKLFFIFCVYMGEPMRTRLSIAALLALSAALPVVPAEAQSQDPEKIIDQYIKAQGGAKSLSKVQTVTIEGTLTNTADGKTGTYTFDTRLPNRYYSELVLGDKNVIEAYNGKSA